MAIDFSCMIKVVLIFTFNVKNKTMYTHALYMYYE